MAFGPMSMLGECLQGFFVSDCSEDIASKRVMMFQTEHRWQTDAVWPMVSRSGSTLINIQKALSRKSQR